MHFVYMWIMSSIVENHQSDFVWQNYILQNYTLDTVESTLKLYWQAQLVGLFNNILEANNFTRNFFKKGKKQALTFVQEK